MGTITINTLNSGTLTITPRTEESSSGNGNKQTVVTYTDDTTNTFAISGELTSSSIENKSNAKAVKIGTDVTSIGNYAFNNCTKLTSITIPNSVTSIGNNAFFGCIELASVTIPSSVERIGTEAFSSCSSLESIEIPSSVTSIGDVAFCNCRALASITIPSSVTSIGSYTFDGCTSLTSIAIPDSVESIGTSAFRTCTSLTSLTVDPNNPNYKSIDNLLLNKAGTNLICCSGGLTNVNIPSSVESIGNAAFYDCTSLANITIPSSVKSIGDYAFAQCASLASVTIGNSVTSIGVGAFNSCLNLSVLDFRSHTSVPTLQSTNAFNNTLSTKKIIVPDALYETWKTSNNWSSTTNNIVNRIIKASDYE